MIRYETETIQRKFTLEFCDEIHERQVRQMMENNGFIIGKTLTDPGDLTKTMIGRKKSKYQLCNISDLVDDWNLPQREHFVVCGNPAGCGRNSELGCGNCVHIRRVAKDERLVRELVRMGEHATNKENVYDF